MYEKFFQYSKLAYYNVNSAAAIIRWASWPSSRIIAPIIPPNGIGTLMYANQGCLCPTQGAAAAAAGWFSPNFGLRNVCMDSSVITGFERCCCCCQRFVNVRTSKQSATRCMCVAAANLSSSSCNLDSGDAGYIYICPFFIHASLPCYITKVLLLVLYAAKYCVPTTDVRTQPNNQRGRRHWLVKFFFKKYFFSWKCCLFIYKCVVFWWVNVLYFEEKGFFVSACWPYSIGIISKHGKWDFIIRIMFRSGFVPFIVLILQKYVIVYSAS